MFQTDEPVEAAPEPVVDVAPVVEVAPEPAPAAKKPVAKKPVAKKK